MVKSRLDTRVLADPASRARSFDEARDLCLALTRAEGENFTVVSWLAPRAMREHLAVVYAFCRTVDNLGDEEWVLGRQTGRTSESAAALRIALLDEFEAELDLAYAGAPRHPIFVALRPTIERFRLPREPFARLIEANRMDQRTKRAGDVRRPPRLLRALGDPGREARSRPLRT